jgi:hypothetical protein
MYLWQVAVHGTVMGFVFYAWARHVGLPSGRTKRALLVLLLVLPLFTAAVPGRSGLDFAERLAWLNTARILAIPLPGGWRVEHLAIGIALLTLAVTVWQELAAPAIRRPRTMAEAPPESLVRLARAQPAWSRCDVALSPLPSILVATTGRPSRPRLIVSRGALEALSDTELASVIAHEHAHWQDGRWWRLHVLFLVRLLQAYHPAALWIFREYCLEVEIECDDAAARADRPLLTRVLYRVYQSTDRHDRASRAVLRKRIDVLMAGGPQNAALPRATLAAAAGLMAVVLPWIV